MREPKHTPSEVCDCKPGYVYHCAGPMLPEAINAVAKWFADNLGDHGYMPLSLREGYALSLHDSLEEAGLHIVVLRKRAPSLPPPVFSSQPLMGIFTPEVDFTLLWQRLCTLLSTAMAARTLLERHPAEEPFRSVYRYVEPMEVQLRDAVTRLMDWGGEIGLSIPIGAPANSPNGDDTQHAETGS